MTDPNLSDPNAEAEEANDEIIGRAFRGSLIVLAIIAAGVVAVLLLRGGTEPAPVASEGVAAAPVAANNGAEPAPPPLPFVDVTGQSGIDFVHENGAYGERLLPETMGGGIAAFDADNDGDTDLLFVNSGSWPWRQDGASAPLLKLYLNEGNWQFVDASERFEKAPRLYGMGVAVGDSDGDGFEDVFVTGIGANLLYLNKGGQRFELADVGVEGEADAWSTSAAFIDYDRDGDLDLFVCNYVQWSRDIDLEVDYQLAGIGRAYGPPTNYAGTQPYLLRNDGGRYTDVSEAVAVKNPATGLPAGKALAVVPLDVNADGFEDLVVANDTVGNFLYVNDGNGGFSEQGATLGVAYDSSGSATGAMGTDVAHYRNDEAFGVAIANFANEMTSLYVAPAAGGAFSDDNIVSGIGAPSRRALSFGLFFFDADLDGRLDLLQANGHVEDEINRVQPSQQHAQKPQLFWNCGNNCRRTFVLVADDAVGALATPLVGRGATWADLDDDGDLDIVITQAGGAPSLLRNDQASGNGFIAIELRQPGSNPRAVGARIEISGPEGLQRRHVIRARSYLSQSPLVQYFGIASRSEVVVGVTWPDGQQQEFTGLKTGRRHVLNRSP